MVKSVRYVEGIIRPPRNQQSTTVMLVGTPSMLVSCPEPHVGFSAPQKKLRIRQVRESQAGTVVAVESSEPSLCPVPRMPSMVDSVSPQVQVEPAGSQVAGFPMGRFAVVAAEVEDDGVLARGRTRRARPSGTQMQSSPLAVGHQSSSVGLTRSRIVSGSREFLWRVIAGQHRRQLFPRVCALRWNSI